ncbi:hypothetical protein shim_26090 [Shimia sp. SK013]|uniref:DUF2125 domain-containing protein n=1 Tax=Shimia sp. SK013 TaxID=1389006 RepID=UPI0006B55D9B|nr:DUF2125 domain-containing protein [Shimia sp. SK013]KPA21144.1 hypothetical protein shim_26090 [Shimia sp. SK013]
MFKATRRLTATAILAALPATWAQADVTAMDVWENMRAHAAVFGGNLAARLEETEDGLKASIITYRTSLKVPEDGIGSRPLHVADIEISLPDLLFAEASDGSVTLHVPENRPIVFDFATEHDFAASIPISVETLKMKARAVGEPGAITYGYTTPRLRFALKFSATDTTIEAAHSMPAVTLASEYSDVDIQTHLTEGDLLKVASTVRVAKTQMRTEIIPPSGLKQITIATSTDQSGSYDIAYPKRLSLISLADSIDRGFSVSMSNSLASFKQTETEIDDNGETHSSVSVSAGRTDTAFSLNSEGLFVEANAVDGRIHAAMMDVLPMPIEVAADQMSLTLNLPLSKANTPAPFAYETTLSGLTLGGDLWSAFDPMTELPRDPASLAIDLSGTLTHKVDWLNFLAVPHAMDALTSLPIEPHDVLINALTLDAAGANLAANGAFSFDLDDMQTYAGMPRPDGQISVDVQGLDGLLDALIAIGLLPENQAMGVRMMLGGFAKSVGEDHLTSTIEMTPSGQILANGQRLK